MSFREEITHELGSLGTSPQDLRKFSWVVGGAFLALGAFLFWRDVPWAPWLLWIGGVLAAVGSVFPVVLKPVYKAWMAMALVLGFVMTRVVLTIVFFLAITPIALVFKLIGRDPLHRAIDRGSSTYWIEKEYLIPDRSRFEKFF